MKIQDTAASPCAFVDEPLLDKSSGDLHCLETFVIYSTLSQLIQKILNSAADSSISPSSDGESIQVSPSDIFHWGYLWDYIKENNLSIEAITNEICQRRVELQAQKEHWRSFTKAPTRNTFGERLNEALTNGYLVPTDQGQGAAYFLYDGNSNPVFVLKPVDEDIFCLNNRKHVASPFNNEEFRVRKDIPLYRSAQTDALGFIAAEAVGIAHITPKAEMHIISSSAFYDLTFQLSDSDKEKLSLLIGSPDLEKLCSVQEFVAESVNMQHQVYRWIQEGLTEENLEAYLCPKDFEDANLFIWITGDTDAHPGNFLVYKKEVSEEGKEVYGIKKIDNGLSFPDDNSDFTNFLMYFDVKHRPLTDRLRAMIKEIPVEKIVKGMQELEMSIPSMVACVKRIRLIQELAKREDMSIYEMNLRLMLLSQEDGIAIAAGNQSISELEKLIGLNTVESSTETSSEATL